MFGVSFSEVLIIAVVALLVVGPKKLPDILGRMGRWAARLRRVTAEVRQQTGIDDILRAEGVSGGINELRSMLRGDLASISRLGATGPQARGARPTAPDPYGAPANEDRWREYPVEGADCYGAIPEDLVPDADGPALAPEAPAPVPPPPGPTEPAATTGQTDVAPAQTASSALPPGGEPTAGGGTE